VHSADAAADPEELSSSKKGSSGVTCGSFRKLAYAVAVPIAGISMTDGRY
jgi:hypothetical protein